MSVTYYLENDIATAAFAARLADGLQAGDCVCLSGGLGVGKTTLARAVIRARLGQHVEVPSPTYTIVNVYEGGIWHADLYRLSDLSEVEELGLLDALPDHLVLIEWPERVAEILPPRRLDIALDFSGDGRLANVSPLGAGWVLPEAVS